MKRKTAMIAGLVAGLIGGLALSGQPGQATSVDMPQDNKVSHETDKHGTGCACTGCCRKDRD